MTSVEEHRKNALSLINDVEEKIRMNLVVERQKLIGFACSEASCDLLAILLHKKNLIDPGFNVNHRFFSSENIAKTKFNFDFPSKNKLIQLLIKQENYRNIICYGKSKDEKTIVKCIENLFEIKKIIENETGEKI